MAVHSQHLVSAKILGNFPVTDYVLDIKTGSVTLDDSWVPYVQSSLVCVAAAPADIELMNPLVAGGLRVSVTVTQSFGPGVEWNSVPRAPVTRTFNLSLRSLRVDHNSGEMTVTLESDEALLRDYAKLTAVAERTYGLSVKTAVTYALAKIVAVLQPGAADAALTGNPLDGAQTNLITNPSFEIGTTNYTSANCTMGRVATWAALGIYSLQLSSPIAGDSYASMGVEGATFQYGMAAGNTYVLSATAKVITPTSGSVIDPARCRGLSVFCYNGATYATFSSTQATNVAGAVTRVSMTFTVPANSTGAFIRLYLGATIGTIQWDAIRLTEKSDTSPAKDLTIPFDGSINPDSGLWTSAWTGPAHASTSILTALPNTDATIWLPGVSAYDWVSPLVSAAGLRLFCDENRKWYLLSALVLDGQITLSPATGIERAADTRSLEDSALWYTGVVITYKAPSDPITGLTPAPTYDIAGTNGHVLKIDRDIANPGSGAAAAILSRAVGKGRVLSVTNESDYNTTPGKALSITLPDTPVQTGSVSSVSWSFPEARMTVASKSLTDTPANAWVFAIGPWSAATGPWSAATGTN